MPKYNPSQIEKKWQEFWQVKKQFFAKDFSKKPKKYILAEFPYPSGAGLHMGHLRPYVAADVYARFSRMRRQEVIFPIGWDAFGLPAENYAIKMGVHPSITTKQNIKNAKKQMLSWGLSFDFSREINTTDPDYYKWTQWIFLQFFKKGLAYEATGLINWCPKDKTGLANEEVIDGKCERCGSAVEKKEMRQWYLRITAYAEKLLEGLKNLPEWPQAVKLQQENWIGKSVGAEIEFSVAHNLKNCLVIHGLSGSSQENWFPWLKQTLEKEQMNVVVPDLPGAGHAKVNEWSNVLSDLIKDFNPDSVIVGHSIGVPAALNLVQTTGKKIDKLILVGPVNSKQHWKELKTKINPKLDWEAVRNFADIKFDWEKISRLVKEIVFYYSDNDKYIPAETVDYYKQNLPHASFKLLKGKGHFNKAAGVLEFQEILEDIKPKIKIFTTRPDTIFGATYMVVAPEHPLIQNFQFSILNFQEVKKYIEKAKKRSEMDRTAEGKEKTGVELKGVKVVNPATGKEIPVWVADYVLWGYGTGAIMAVPAHDNRDFEFAKKYNLPIRQVVGKPVTGNLIPPLSDIGEGERERLGAAMVDYGVLINSGKFDGLKSEEAIPKMAEAFGKLTTQYKLRDWVFSRQRYWGEPIPLIHCEDCGVVPVPEKDLPVLLPNVKKYEPTGTGESPLADVKSWLEVKCPECKKLAWRETNTMPNWAGSSWYWLRYADPKNKKEFASVKKQEYWTPVDVYFGGMEHTTLHLLYSRFWNLFLHDEGRVPAKEPFIMRKPHGIVLGPDGEKMSKSRGNVVDPQIIVKKYGADTLRMYEMFLGPHEAMVAFNDKGVVGVKRFLDRVWEWGNKLKIKNEKLKISGKIERQLHKLIKRITDNIAVFRFNTCVSAFMEFHNEVKDEAVDVASIKTFLILLYPFAPHVAEELNQIIGGRKSLQFEPWPAFDASLIVDKEVEIVVQVNGKVKAKIKVASGSEEETAKAESLKLDVVKKALVNDSIKRVIFVKDRLINLVI